MGLYLQNVSIMRLGLRLKKLLQKLWELGLFTIYRILLS